MQDWHVWDVTLVAESWRVIGKAPLQPSVSESTRATSRGAGMSRKNSRTPSQMISPRFGCHCPMRLLGDGQVLEAAKSW